MVSLLSTPMRELPQTSESHVLSFAVSMLDPRLKRLAALLGVEQSALWEGPQVMPATPEQRLIVEKMKGMTVEQQQALLAFVAATSKA